FQFAASNNEAEYEALIAGLRITAQMGVQNVYVSVNSKLVSNQVLGTYVAKEENMIEYLEKVKSLVLVAILKEKSIQEKEVTTVVEEDGSTWMTPIMEYLKQGTLPSDRKEARKLRIKARQYELLEGVLYRRSFLALWLRTTTKWSVMLGEHNITYRPKTSVKGQVVADFLAEVSDESSPAASVVGTQQEQWTLFTDGSSCVDGSGAGLILTSQREQSLLTRFYFSLQLLTMKLNLLEERRECVAIREAKAKLKMTKYYNARVRGVTFRPGDFVYRNNDASHAVDEGKLGPK
nr:reverse transcriptase domain-containing protein [Tanacetum cinerariifolium]